MIKPQNCKRNTSSEQVYMDLFARTSARMLTDICEDDFIQETLADIGQTMQICRAYIFEIQGDVWNNTYEWVSIGTSSHKHELQNLDLKNWQNEGDMFHLPAQGKPYVVDNVDNIENFEARTLLQKQGVKALITIPLFNGIQLSGLFGIDACDEINGWGAQHVNYTIILASLLNNARNYFNAQRALQKKKIQVQALFDALPYPVYISSIENYSMLFYNKSIRDLFNLDTTCDLPCYKALQNLDEPCQFCTNAVLKKGDPPYIWHHHNPIAERDYKIIDRCMSWEHTHNARLSIACDITDSLRLQREQVLEREANVAKGIFLANMSHELRTPLNGIIGLTHLADKANTDKSVANYLSKIQLSSKNLLGIINDILDFSKIDDTNFKLESHIFSLSDVLFEAQAILQTEVDRKDIYLRCILDDKIPPLLKGDSLRLSQIILNLCNNAIKFTKKGGVTLEAQVISEQDEIINIILSVQDTGIGISSESLKKLFSEFTQAETSTTRRFGGTGLGLTIVKRLVELMGGRISVESCEGKGSKFICDIPFVKAQEQAEHVVSVDKHVEENIANVRVLLVEDNEINTLIAKEVLEQFGCIVDCAEDGNIALEKIEQNLYDIVLMDIQMPNMDGLEAAGHIRKQACYNNLPIVAMSAHAMVQDHEKSRMAGMQDHITKPFDPDNLRHIIYKFTTEQFNFKKNL